MPNADAMPCISTLRPLDLHKRAAVKPVPARNKAHDSRRYETVAPESDKSKHFSTSETKGDRRSRVVADDAASFTAIGFVVEIE